MSDNNSDQPNHEEQTPATPTDMLVFLVSHISNQLRHVTESLELLCVANKPQIDEYMRELNEQEAELGEDLREYPGDRLPTELTEISD